MPAAPGGHEPSWPRPRAGPGWPVRSGWPWRTAGSRSSSRGELFASFDRDPIAAASIAQVHAATLQSGAKVVVKVCRPGVDAAVERDLDVVTRLAVRLQRSTSWGRAVGAVELSQGFADALREELDLRIEARNMTSVATATAARGQGRVRVPVPHPPLCGQNVRPDTG